MGTKKIKLTVADRLTIQSILPTEGGLVQQITKREIIKKIQFTPSEITSFEMKDVQRGVSFNPAKAVDVDIQFEPSEMALINSAIETVDSEGKVTQENLSTVLKFIELKDK